MSSETPHEKILEILKQFPPEFREQLNNFAKDGIKANKLAIYEMFWKNNQGKDINRLDDILRHSENTRIIVSFNHGKRRYTISVGAVEIIDETERQTNSKK